MSFKNPEVLYALFLLIIPILVHLFRFRKFPRESFTNVRFLKKVMYEGRKSSVLKKWLLLCTRLLLLSSVIVAFAGPFIPPENGRRTDPEMIIFLDNSYSMEVDGAQGPLLTNAVQDLLKDLPDNAEVTLFTNDAEYPKMKGQDIKKEIQSINFSPGPFDWKAVRVKASRAFSDNPAAPKVFLAISDFRLPEAPDSWEIKGAQNYLVKLPPLPVKNYAVDTAYIEGSQIDQTQLLVEISHTDPEPSQLAVTLYDGNRILGKKSVELHEGKRSEVSFSFPTAPVPEGLVTITGDGFQFDNRLFFSINKPAPIQVVIIGSAPDDFLKRIYKEPAFVVNSFPPDSVDFGHLERADLIILNEIGEITIPQNLQEFLKEKTPVVIIPPADVIADSYSTFLEQAGLPDLKKMHTGERLITTIHYDHPLYEGVFQEEVRNFEYPRVKTSYVIEGGNAVLSYGNGDPFLSQLGNVYLFSAPINSGNSDFQNSPLIVPTFFNIGNAAISSPRLYYLIGNDQEISLQTELEKDQILKLSSDQEDFIPQQQNYRGKTVLYLNALPSQPGHFTVRKEDQVLKTLSFNISRFENATTVQEPKEIAGLEVTESVAEALQSIEAAGEVETLWKWFIIFALAMLLTEIFILIFLK